MARRAVGPPSRLRGGPETDLFPADVEAIDRDAGVPVLTTDTLVPHWLVVADAWSFGHSLAEVDKTAFELTFATLR